MLGESGRADRPVGGVLGICRIQPEFVSHEGGGKAEKLIEGLHVGKGFLIEILLDSLQLLETSLCLVYMCYRQWKEKHIQIKYECFCGRPKHQNLELLRLLLAKQSHLYYLL